MNPGKSLFTLVTRKNFSPLAMCFILLGNRTDVWLHNSFRVWRQQDDNDFLKSKLHEFRKISPWDSFEFFCYITFQIKLISEIQNIGIPSLVKQKPGPVANGWLNAFTSQSDQVAIRGQTVEIWAKRKNLPSTFLSPPKLGKHLSFLRTEGRLKHNIYDIFIWIMALALNIFNLLIFFSTSWQIK